MAHGDLRKLLLAHSASGSSIASNQPATRQDSGDIAAALHRALRDALQITDEEQSATARIDGCTAGSSSSSSSEDGDDGGEGELVVVCGSAFIMSQARAVIGIREPRDGDELFIGNVAPSDSRDGKHKEKKASSRFADAQVLYCIRTVLCCIVTDGDVAMHRSTLATRRRFSWPLLLGAMKACQPPSCHRATCWMKSSLWPRAGWVDCVFLYR
jgi:hypothetical protein